jgi:hypothetical protein
MMIIGDYTILSNGLVNNFLVKYQGEIVATGLTLEGAKSWIERQKGNDEQDTKKNQA